MADSIYNSSTNKDLGENRSTQVLARQSLQFPMQVKVMTEPEIRAYHRKKLEELSTKSIKSELVFGVDGNVYDSNGDLVEEEPTFEQKQWIVFRLTHSDTWSKVHENKIGDSKNWIGGADDQ